MACSCVNLLRGHSVGRGRAVRITLSSASFLFDAVRGPASTSSVICSRPKNCKILESTSPTFTLESELLKGRFI